jgi:hypothetical protein
MYAIPCRLVMMGQSPQFVNSIFSVAARTNMYGCERRPIGEVMEGRDVRVIPSKASIPKSRLHHFWRSV